jgi:NAD(P)-dependent dehydrogenase (short-subunit alcohol dehydrogenase family)
LPGIIPICKKTAAARRGEGQHMQIPEPAVEGQLKGKVALVSGAASGIGRASAILFAQAGASVVALDRAAEVEDTVASIRKDNGRALAIVADSSQEDNISGAIDTAVREFGALDVCFANAGISGGLVPLHEQTPEYWVQVLTINLIGTFLAVKHAARVMTPRKRGSIVCTASVAGLRSGAGGSPYSASKAGVISLVQTTAYQLSGSGVRINAICPGLIETGMTQSIFEQARARGTDNKIGQLNPLRRAGAPIEIARMALFLASDAASYVNGQAFPVDGGLSSSHPIVPPKL